MKSAKAVSGDTLADHAQRRHGASWTTRSVIKTDIQASNGVIHVIDSVILPKGL